jgi:hypothetical protein
LVGGIDIHPLVDGTFRASPGYFGDHASAEGHEDLFIREGFAWLPIGCFLVRTGGRTILVDAGMGPAMREDGPRRPLVGGQLMLGLTLEAYLVVSRLLGRYVPWRPWRQPRRSLVTDKGVPVSLETSLE